MRSYGGIYASHMRSEGNAEMATLWSNDWLEVPGPHAVEITSVPIQGSEECNFCCIHASLTPG